MSSVPSPPLERCGRGRESDQLPSDASSGFMLALAPAVRPIDGRWVQLRSA
jgi:hypothetical protein